ncbi:MAG: hypothetical protein PHW95_01895 [Patescibacteria group bacterium]|nr:hypothetical protein [Patescibacteria group bacterium]
MNKIFNSISRAEWQWVAWLTTLVMILTIIPYLLGYWLAPANTVYNGIHALSPGDIPVYYSYINQAASGKIFFTDLFTTEKQTLGTFNVWWLGIGLLAGLLQLSAPVIFQLSRLAMIPVFTVVLYFFLSYLFNDSVLRRLAFFLVLFSSGVGAYVSPALDSIAYRNLDQYPWPIDLWLVESNTFNALYQTSHFIASITLTLLIFILMLLAFETGKVRYAVWGGLAALFYFNFHPYYVPVIYGTVGLYWLVCSFKAKKLLWQYFWQLIIFGVISVPSVFYHAWLIQNSFVIGIRATQNVTLISPLIYVLLGYGFLIPGFLFGLAVVKKLKINQRVVWLLLSWLVVSVALIYSPFPFHSRYTQGVQIVLAIFTAVGLLYFYRWAQIHCPRKIYDFWIKNPALWLMLFILLFAPSNIYGLVRDVYYAVYQPGEIATYYYIPTDDLQAFAWLKNQPKIQNVLSFGLADSFIPAFSGQASYAAHAQETLFFNSKFIQVVWFYGSNINDSAKEKFLAANNITFVFYSDYEKKLGDFAPSQKKYLSLVFSTPTAKIYQVIQP